MSLPSVRRWSGWLVSLSTLAVFASGAQAQQTPVTRANWAQADKFSQENLRGALFSTALAARFINKTDSAWYQWQDRNGSRFMLVVPRTNTRQPLFDHVRFAAELSTLHRRPYESHNLPFTTIDFADSTNASVFQFRVDTMLYQYDLRTAAMKSLGRAPRQAPGGGRGGRGGGGGGRGGRAGGQGLGAPQDFRNFSPDSTAFVFARDHNLFYVEVGKPDTVKISTDGVQNYSFGARDTTTQNQQQQQQQDDIDDTQRQENEQGRQGGQGQNRSRDPRVRPNGLTWSTDSRAFTSRARTSAKSRNCT